MSHEFAIGPQSASDDPFTARHRLVQSTFRAEVLKTTYGSEPTKNGPKHRGNILENGEETGLNFITPEAFRSAKAKCREKALNTNLVIDEESLFNNMLSSTPLCFNLFSDLRAILVDSPERATKIVQALFPDLTWIASVNYIDILFVPQNIDDYIEDSTAFDCMMITTDTAGLKGLIAIQTKYSEKDTSTIPAREGAKQAILDRLKVFGPAMRALITERGFTKIERNFLLSVAFCERHEYKHFVNIILSPSDDPTTPTEIDDFAENLRKWNNRIVRIDLEEVISRGLTAGDEVFATAMATVKERYFPQELPNDRPAHS